MGGIKMVGEDTNHGREGFCNYAAGSKDLVVSGRFIK